MSNTKRQQLIVGLFFLCSAVIFTWLLLFLKPSYGDGKRTLRVRFTEIEQLGLGTRVTLAGKPIGEVASIHSIANARNQEPIQGQIYNYELRLNIDSNARIFPEDIITSQTAGLLGERTIAIIPQRFEETNYKMVDENDILYAQNSPSVEEAFEKFGHIALKVERTVDRLEQILSGSAPHLKNASAQLSEALTHLNQQMGRASSLGVIDKFYEMNNEVALLSSHLNRVSQELFTPEQMERYKNTLASLESLTRSLDKPKEWESLFAQTTHGLETFNRLQHRLIQTWPKLEMGIDSISESANQINRLSSHGLSAMRRFDQISSHVASGKGSLGRLLMDDSLYLGSHETLARINILLSDINNYGLLFHNSRKWRNVRMDNAVTSQRLRHPTAFQNYYQSQVDEIYLSIGRIRELMEASEHKSTKDRMAVSGQFDEVFSDLIKKVNTLSQQLALIRDEISAPETSQKKAPKTLESSATKESELEEKALRRLAEESQL